MFSAFFISMCQQFNWRRYFRAFRLSLSVVIMNDRDLHEIKVVWGT
jgi:hypothetical protein